MACVRFLKHTKVKEWQLKGAEVPRQGIALIRQCRFWVIGDIVSLAESAVERLVKCGAAERMPLTPEGAKWKDESSC